MRYPALVTVMMLLKVVAGIYAVVGILAFLLLMTKAFLSAVGALIGLLLGAVLVYATAQIIQVVIDIEENTRKTSESLGNRG